MSDKTERTKEEILKKHLTYYLGTPDSDKAAKKHIYEAMEEYRQISPVESKLKKDFLEGDKLLGLAAHFVTPEPDGSANKAHFTDLVAVLMYYNDYLQGKIEEPKEK